MDEYVAKPIHPHELLQAIIKLVGDRDTASNDEPETAEALATSYAWTEKFAGVTNAPELRKLLAETIIQETPHLLDSLHEAVADADPDKLRLAAHTLRGSIRYFDMGPAHELAAQLETMGRDGSVQGAADLLPELQREMEQLLAALRERL
jgi:HPt (histidine-containing phosphotransfer) domain-containing protein